jgi:DNA polymerase-3 subunit delta'
MALRPLEAARKVYIIRGADDLAEEGANALLKTLEEPPPAVTLILTAPDPSALLPTIVSRCQLLSLHPAASGEIATHLVGVLGIDSERAEAIALSSGGRTGWAVLASANDELVATRDQRAAELIGLLTASRLERISAADALAERWTGHADEVRDTLETWRDVWHDLLMVQSGLVGNIRHVGLSRVDR